MSGPRKSDVDLNAAVESYTRAELRRQASKVAMDLRKLAERIEGAAAEFDQVDTSGLSVSSYADVAADMQREVWVTLYNTPLPALTQLAAQADTARALATREDHPPAAPRASSDTGARPRIERSTP